MTESTESRFSFGENWLKFLKELDTERIQQAEESLLKILNRNNIKGKKFLDIGCGSGLFSLAARNLGATVVSFDYDDDSVRCARILKERYHEGDENWAVMQGSILDDKFLSELTLFDVVYSWGVLHHTGDMHRAFERASKLVKENGYLAVAIYNDQGGSSRRWKAIKKGYGRIPPFLRPVYVTLAMAPLELRHLVGVLARREPSKYFDLWKNYGNDRGMSRWRDMVDWVGGYPFEVASPDEIFNFFKDRNFRLDYLKTVKGAMGCNEFGFTKIPQM